MKYFSLVHFYDNNDKIFLLKISNVIIDECFLSVIIDRITDIIKKIKKYLVGDFEVKMTRYHLPID
jgi:hypothetical protein